MLLITRNQFSNLMLGLKVKYRSGISQASSLNYQRRTKLLFHSDPNAQQGRPQKGWRSCPTALQPSHQRGCFALFSWHLLGPAQPLPFLNFILMHFLTTELKKKLKSPLKYNLTKFIKILQVIISPKSFLNKNEDDFCFKIQHVSV